MLEQMAQRQMQKWVKQTARVPRGYLRFQIMILLNEEPMSGSEISDRIERDTEGEYRPGSGSIYPVLKKLHESRFIERLPIEDGVQRYRLTSQGHTFFDENQEVMEEVRKRLDSVEPPFSGLMQHFPEIRTHFYRASKTMMALGEIPPEKWTRTIRKRVERGSAGFGDGNQRSEGECRWPRGGGEPRRSR